MRAEGLGGIKGVQWPPETLSCNDESCPALEADASAWQTASQGKNEELRVVKAYPNFDFYSIYALPFLL